MAGELTTDSEPALLADDDHREAIQRRWFVNPNATTLNRIIGSLEVIR